MCLYRYLVSWPAGYTYRFSVGYIWLGTRLIDTSLIPRPRPAFHHLQYGKWERAWNNLSCEWHTIEALIKAPLKNNYDPQRRLVWSAKKYFGPLGAPCLERRLWIRAQLAPFQWIREVCMATLKTDELEYVIPGYREYKRVWSPEINEKSSATVKKN